MMKLSRLVTKSKVGNDPAHGDESGDQVGGYGTQGLGEVGEHQARDDRAQEDVEGELHRAVHGRLSPPFLPVGVLTALAPLGDPRAAGALRPLQIIPSP